MRNSLLLLLLVSSGALLLGGAGCKAVECGEGTIERSGACVPADEVISEAKCGAFTMLVGNECIPMFRPTVCQDETTDEDVDPETGVITCIGTGGGGCGAPLACPIAGGGKQTICGQLFNFETNEPFAAGNATGTRCAAGATTGPCAVGIRAFDAIMFASNPGAATPLAVDETYIDDCGRYKLEGISVPGGPFIGLGIDDAMAANQGPAGVTNTVGIATPKAAGTATPNLEGFVVPASTTSAWASSGGPPLSGGIYAMVFRAGSTGAANRPGITFTRAGSTVPANDQYFTAAQTTRTTVDPAANVTGANGTALIINATIADSLAYSGTGLPAECRYTTHAGASLPFIVFIQVLRPINAIGMTCPL